MTRTHQSFILNSFLIFLVLFAHLFLAASDQIPAIAWRIPIGQPPANPGGQKPELTNIDDGFWQGAPVGGIGAGTFSRSYRGNFERWHIKAGVHKYQNVPANQFAVFVQPEGEPAMAQVLSTGKPDGGALSAWNWSYPAGAGEYAALYPKSWFAYRSPQLPITLTIEQFSPVLPNNYKETSYPVAVYNWYAENPSSKPVTVSLLFSWTNMVGWFRDTTSQLPCRAECSGQKHIPFGSDGRRNHAGHCVRSHSHWPRVRRMGRPIRRGGSRFTRSRGQLHH